MDTLTDPSRPGLGHNNPPDPIEVLRSTLAENHADLLKRCAELLGLEARLPAVMDDEWEAKVSEAIKSCGAFTKNSEATRLAANEPHRKAIAATDGFFKAMSDKVDRLKAKMTAEYLTPYQQKKADEVKRRREEEARLARERAEEAARLAREEAARVAEAKRKEEAAKAEAERVKRERAEAEARRKREAEEVARKAAEAKAEAERREAEARTKRQREAAEKARLKAEQEAAEREAEIRRKAAEEKAEAKRKADEAAAEAKRLADERREQERKAREARDEAAGATQKSNIASRATRVSEADRSRTRTDLGAVASLHTTYTFEIIDRDAIPRIYLEVSEPAINAAIKAATKDGQCTLKIEGVRIFPVTLSKVR